MRHLIYNTTESKFHDVQIKTLSQICDRSNRFQAISTQLTSNLSTSTVAIGAYFRLSYVLHTADGISTLHHRPHWESGKAIAYS